MEHDSETPDQPRDWGRALLASEPWQSVSDRITLLLVDPPTGIDGQDETPARAAFWLTMAREAGRALPAPYGPAIAEDRAVVEHPRLAGAGALTLSVLSDDAMHRLLEGTTRASIEARWLARHHAVIVDRMRRGEQYATRAGLLPEDALERVTRTLFLEVVTAIAGLVQLERSPAGGLAAAGEAAAALCRLACFDEAGAYPPVSHLRSAAAETRLGRRLLPWLDDIARAVGGDEAAIRRSVSSGDQVVEEARTILGERYRNRPWLRTPEAYALRVPR